MMQQNSQNENLYDLFGALCNETITTEQHLMLEKILAEDAEARRDYFNYLELHLNLERLHDEQPETEIDFHFHAQTIPNFQEKVSSKNTFTTTQSLWLMVTAICATIVGSFLFLNLKPSTPTQISQVETSPKNISVAEVTQTAAVRFADGAPVLKVGSPIETYQEYAISAGQVQIVFSNGAEVILTGPAVFESGGIEHLAIRYGACSVYAPEGAEGFTVETPLSNVVDYGTRFSVNVSEAGNTDVQVIEGETDVRPIKRDDNSGITAKRLTKGMAQRLTTNNGLVVDQIPFDSHQYVSTLPDRVISYTTTVGPRRKAEDLTSVTIQRGGTAYQYAVEDLIGIELTHYKGSSFLTRNDGIDPATDGNPLTLRRHLLDQDRSLLTGVVNPSGSTTPLTAPPVMNEVEDPNQPNTPGMAIRFREPVINDAGPDIVLFDLQVIVHTTAGDAFYATPLPFASKRKTHKIEQFDIDLASPEAKSLEKFWLHIFNNKQKSGISSRNELETALGNGGNLHIVGAKALAVGIDLSDLGFAEGETVEGLFLQDAQDNADIIDPVFIAGLPPLKRPKK
ncbi:MAG: FecR family protein [Planctomycetes bacterium]|nr:FecR family protein [Planctomycetota bacterium]MCH9727556.1 FecR family protein [Planctomycetota bacterium]MCH9777464.1 FecR family protein [Planctomycetota bacterium]MCH9793329.1 FecR family protein [Planctomycetota bacterium]